MNIVLRLKAEREELERAVDEALDELVELQLYLALPKFHGVENDWVGVSTDVAPKVSALRSALLRAGAVGREAREAARGGATARPLAA